MQHYVLSFIFNTDMSQVLLIHKNRPAWQAGKINGIGGKIEKDETAVDAIAREVTEETGLVIRTTDWKEVGSMHGEEWRIHVFTTVLKDVSQKPTSVTDEVVAWFPINELPETVISNLKWLVPLAVETLNGNVERADIQYSITKGG